MTFTRSVSLTQKTQLRLNYKHQTVNAAYANIFRENCMESKKVHSVFMTQTP